MADLQREKRDARLQTNKQWQMSQRVPLYRTMKHEPSYPNVRSNCKITGKVGTIEKEVTGLRTSFHETLTSSLEADSKSMMSPFKELIQSMPTAKKRDRGATGRSRSPKHKDTNEMLDEEK